MEIIVENFPELMKDTQQIPRKIKERKEGKKDGKNSHLDTYRRHREEFKSHKKNKERLSSKK